ncbi:MAG: hypothetical protein M0Z41_14450 [Peptococcaceae bacterium]|nr:hypothetical protein [Peptococcaceae bacterium]
MDYDSAIAYLRELNRKCTACPSGVDRWRARCAGGGRFSPPWWRRGGGRLPGGFRDAGAARWAAYLVPGGEALVNRHRVLPPAVNTGQADYPGEEEITGLIAAQAGLVWWIEGPDVVSGLGPSGCRRGDPPGGPGQLPAGFRRGLAGGGGGIGTGVPRRPNRRDFTAGRTLACPQAGPAVR